MTKSRGINRPKTRWTPVMVELLRQWFPFHPTAVVAGALRLTERAVSQKAAALCLRKSPEYLASDKSGRILRGRTDPRMVATQFKKGLVPWNTGAKGVTGVHPNSRATQFKKGQMHGAAQHNYVPIGSLRISADGALERKVTDDHSVYPAKRWRPVARLVWEATHGPIPAGHIVVFRPGKKTIVAAEITVDRLECISRAENARRNHPRSKSPELGQLVQIKGQITRQVNRITREHAQRSAS
jgi:hypothetical protein